MAMSRRGQRGGPQPAAGVRASSSGARVVTPAPDRAAAARQEQMRQMMSGRPGRVRLLGEQLNGQFFREAWSELKKVHWPTRVQARNLTALVIGVSVLVGMILGGMDVIFSKIFQLILGSG